MIIRNPDFYDEPPQQVPQVLPNQFFEEPSRDGFPCGIRLLSDALLFLSALNLCDELKVYRHKIVSAVLPAVDDHLEQLRQELENNTAKRDRFSRPLAIQKFRWEIALSPLAFPLLTALIICSVILIYAINFDINNCVAAIREGSLFETPSSNPMMPAIEPSFELCLGLSFIPIFGLFIALEFICWTFNAKVVRPFLRNLAIVTLPLALGCIWAFAYIFGQGSTVENVVGTDFQSPAPPWFFFGLITTTLGCINAMLMHGIVRITSYFFEEAPKQQQYCVGLENDRQRLLDCILATSKTLGILTACREADKLAVRRCELVAQLANLDTDLGERQ